MKSHITYDETIKVLQEIITLSDIQAVLAVAVGICKTDLDAAEGIRSSLAESSGGLSDKLEASVAPVKQCRGGNLAKMCLFLECARNANECFS